MGGGRDPRPFRPFSVFRIPQAGSPRSLLRSLRASPPRARDDLFPFRKVCRGKGSIGLVLVFEGGSGLRTSGREEGFTASIGLACWGLGGGTVGLAAAVCAAAAKLCCSQFAAATAGWPGLSHSSSGSCALQAGWLGPASYWREREGEKEVCVHVCLIFYRFTVY